MIVALEGIDASGKATQSRLLYEWFTHRDSLRFADVKQHDFPHYETVAGGVVGRILRGETLVATREDIDAVDERDDYLPKDELAKRWSRDKAIIIQSVMIADRLEWMPLLVEFAQSPDNLLILDRYKVSGIAYGVADGIEASWLRTIQSCIPDADLNILLDISADESSKRRPERRDYYERQIDKLHKVRGYYLREFNGFSSAFDESCIVVSGAQEPQRILDELVIAILRKKESIEEETKLTIEVEKS